MDSEQIREQLARLAGRARAALEAALTELRRLLAPLVAAWARFAIERWERVRAYLATHPDLVDLDSWLDRWYSFGTA